MTEFMSMIVDGLTRPLTYFIHPAQRLFIPAILTSLLMAVGAYFYYQKKGNLGPVRSFRNLLVYLFPKRIWTHKSSVVDYEIIFLNAVLYVALVGPFLVYLAFFTDAVRGFLDSNLGVASAVSWSHGGILFAYTFTLIFFDDFIRFFQHWLFHKVPLFWSFHKVHHAAIVLTPFTNYRNHPVESFIFHCRRIFTYGVVTGTFLYFVGNNLSLLDVVYASLARKIFNHVGSNLRHTHIWISWGKFMEHIFISPAQHQIHHSDAPEHRDRNMGSALALWDWMFGTLVLAGEQKDLVLGLGETENRRYTSFWDNIAMPFVDTWYKITGLPTTLKNLTAAKNP
jgi:sterol desaturase/sphingolipid hydroxylase (fatty acid hydroxylase superfamily)